MKIRIFLFHRVSPMRDPLWDPVDPQAFERIIALLKKKYTVVQLEDTVLGPHNIRTSKPLAAVVFDDGYKDFIGFALPVLKKHECPSSMYVVTDCVTQQLPPWTYILDYHFANSKKLELKLNTSLLPEHMKTGAFRDNEERIAYAKQFKPFLKTIPDTQRAELYQQVIASLDDVSVPRNLMMSWDELRQIKNEGVEIGSHTVTHPLLAKIDSEAAITAEIKGSGQLIERELGAFPRTLSYPIGSYDARVKAIAAQSGYQLGLAVNQGFYDSAKQDLFEIPRTELYNESMFKTKLRISGLAQQLKRIRG